jgi:cobalamin biosynthesis Mg chelatase CobN
MPSQRLGRAAILLVAVATGLLALGVLGGVSAASDTAAPAQDCGLPTLPACTTTSITPTTAPTTAPTTTTEQVTSTTEQVTSTTRHRSTTTTERAVAEPTTTTELTPTTTKDVLVPGDGTKGAQSTTTTTIQTPTKISTDSSSDGPKIAAIIIGLLVLAVAVGILTWRYFVATRPSLTAH